MYSFACLIDLLGFTLCCSGSNMFCAVFYAFDGWKIWLHMCSFLTLVISLFYLIAGDWKF